jgi:hypothetical protein
MLLNKTFKASLLSNIGQIITEYSIKNSSSQAFKPNKELQQFHHKPSNGLPLLTALRNNQVYPFKKVKRIFVKTEL